MLNYIGIGLEILACYLLLKLFFSTCRVGVLGAIIGAIVCIFVPYKLETCALWGFCIGMVFQFVTDWHRMLVELVCAALGFGVAIIVFYILKFCGAPYEYQSSISILIWLGFWCLGSSDAAEEVADSFDFSSISSPINFKSGGVVHDHPNLNGIQRSYGIDAEEDSPNRCYTCSWYSGGYCGYHKISVDELNGCLDHT